jgi:hypothetical protein
VIARGASRRRADATRAARAARAWLAGLAALAFLAAGAASGRAQLPPESERNLLATARLIDSLDVAGTTAALRDDAVAAEGGRWSAARGAEFLSAAASLTYDLGADTPIAAAFVQGDAYATFSLQVSDDGRHFREIWIAPMARHAGQGQRLRYSSFFDVHGRYVRFGEPTGPGSHTASEVQIFRALPIVWPPALTVLEPLKPVPPAPRPWYRLARDQYNVAKMGLALAGAWLVAWGVALRRRGAPDRAKRLRDALLLLLGIVGFTGYFNWGAYHFFNRIHYHEFFHYFVGAKYFPELGYSGLYEAANLAEADDGFRRRVELRRTRDLRRNVLVPAKYVLEDPERYRSSGTRRFTPERWEAFRKDMRFFRDHSGIVYWEKALMDHGYNPSPVWNMAGSLLSNLGPATDKLIDRLAWIDPLLLVLSFGFIVWAFGWRTACVASLFFGTNHPALYFWTGGAFLRQDWFLFAVMGICLLKRGKPGLAGASLAVSTLLRVFPGGFFVAIGLRILWILYRERRFDPTAARLVAGAALATILLLPASSVVAGSADAWPQFLRNTKKHAASPLTNYMGLRTIAGFRWETRQKVLYDALHDDPFHSFKEAHRAAFRPGLRLAIYAGLILLYLALVLVAVRREMDWWVSAAFGFGVIAFAAELTCYYYSFLTVAAFLGEKQEDIPIGLLLFSALSQFISFQTYYYDMRFTLESVAAVTFVVWATWVYASRPGNLPPAGAGSTTSAPAPA